ncbi:MAG: LysR family transcriptional regulator [Rhizobiales bacterium]|nr:LysR family transcriptional regulator [Hyphomicrobiales bacterium]
MLKSRLPPLDNLIAFEAAARLLSFTKAAHELNVTQAAVSQQIRNLEQGLGLKLFERAHRAVRLTSAGREYQHTVSASLRHLASATGDIRLSQSQPRLTIACDQSIAALLLLPRLSAFKALYRDVSLRMIVSDSIADCLSDETQVAVIHGTGDWPGYSSRRLFKEEVFPVCSPAYLAQTGPIANANELAQCDLLNLDDEQWDWMNWRVWFNSKGMDLPFERRSLEVNNYPLLIEAAKAGHGMALGWRGLVDDALQQGSLVCPIDETVETDFAYYLVWPDRYERTAEVEGFSSWFRACWDSNKIHG